MFVYDIASKTSGAAIGVQGSGLSVTEYYVGSVTGKYVVQVSNDTKSLLIFKDGALIQTIDVTAYGAVSIDGNASVHNLGWTICHNLRETKCHRQGNLLDFQGKLKELSLRHFSLLGLKTFPITRIFK